MEVTPRNLRNVRHAAVAALLLAGVAMPAAGQGTVFDAQTYRATYSFATGYGGGYMNFGTLNPGAAGTEIGLQPGWVVHIFGEGPALGDHVGVRVLGAFSQRPFDFADDARSINTWLLDAGIVLRPVPLAEGRAASPFVVAGLGLVTHGFGREGRTVIIPDADARYSGDDQTRFQLSIGGGIDVVPANFSLAGTQLGIRLDVADHIALRSQFTALDGERFGPVHNIRAGISLVGLGWF